MNDLRRKLLLVLIYIPLLASANIDCGEKPFHCVNSTHFNVCVDLGTGKLITINSIIIECPQGSVCLETNHYECEFPPSTTPVIQTSEVTSVSDIFKTKSIGVIYTTSTPFDNENDDTNYNTVSTTTLSEAEIIKGTSTTTEHTAFDLISVNYFPTKNETEQKDKSKPEENVTEDIQNKSASEKKITQLSKIGENTSKTNSNVSKKIEIDAKLIDIPNKQNNEFNFSAPVLQHPIDNTLYKVNNISTIVDHSFRNGTALKFDTLTSSSGTVTINEINSFTTELTTNAVTNKFPSKKADSGPNYNMVATTTLLDAKNRKESITTTTEDISLENESNIQKIKPEDNKVEDIHNLSANIKKYLLQSSIKKRTNMIEESTTETSDNIYPKREIYEKVTEIINQLNNVSLPGNHSDLAELDELKIIQKEKNVTLLNSSSEIDDSFTMRPLYNHIFEKANNSFTTTYNDNNKNGIETTVNDILISSPNKVTIEITSFTTELPVVTTTDYGINEFSTPDNQSNTQLYLNQDNDTNYNTVSTTTLSNDKNIKESISTTMEVNLPDDEDMTFYVNMAILYPYKNETNNEISKPKDNETEGMQNSTASVKKYLIKSSNMKSTEMNTFEESTTEHFDNIYPKTDIYEKVTAITNQGNNVSNHRNYSDLAELDKLIIAHKGKKIDSLNSSSDIDAFVTKPPIYNYTFDKSNINSTTVDNTNKNTKVDSGTNYYTVPKTILSDDKNIKESIMTTTEVILSDDEETIFYLDLEKPFLSKNETNHEIIKPKNVQNSSANIKKYLIQSSNMKSMEMNMIEESTTVTFDNIYSKTEIYEKVTAITNQGNNVLSHRNYSDLAEVDKLIIGREGNNITSLNSSSNIEAFVTKNPVYNYTFDKSNNNTTTVDNINNNIKESIKTTTEVFSLNNEETIFDLDMAKPFLSKNETNSQITKSEDVHNSSASVKKYLMQSNMKSGEMNTIEQSTTETFDNVNPKTEIYEKVTEITNLLNNVSVSGNYSDLVEIDKIITAHKDKKVTSLNSSSEVDYFVTNRPIYNYTFDKSNKNLTTVHKTNKNTKANSGTNYNTVSTKTISDDKNIKESIITTIEVSPPDDEEDMEKPMPLKNETNKEITEPEDIENSSVSVKKYSIQSSSIEIIDSLNSLFGINVPVTERSVRNYTIKKSNNKFNVNSKRNTTVPNDNSTLISSTETNTIDIKSFTIELPIVTTTSTKTPFHKNQDGDTNYVTLSTTTLYEIENIKTTEAPSDVLENTSYVIDVKPSLIEKEKDKEKTSDNENVTEDIQISSSDAKIWVQALNDQNKKMDMIQENASETYDMVYEKTTSNISVSGNISDLAEEYKLQIIHKDEIILPLNLSLEIDTSVTERTKYNYIFNTTNNKSAIVDKNRENTTETTINDTLISSIKKVNIEISTFSTELPILNINPVTTKFQSPLNQLYKPFYINSDKNDNTVSMTTSSKAENKNGIGETTKDIPIDDHKIIPYTIKVKPFLSNKQSVKEIIRPKENVSKFSASVKNVTKMNFIEENRNENYNKFFKKIEINGKITDVPKKQNNVTVLENNLNLAEVDQSKIDKSNNRFPTIDNSKNSTIGSPVYEPSTKKVTIEFNSFNTESPIDMTSEFQISLNQTMIHDPSNDIKSKNTQSYTTMIDEISVNKTNLNIIVEDFTNKYYSFLNNISKENNNENEKSNFNMSSTLIIDPFTTSDELKVTNEYVSTLLSTLDQNNVLLRNATKNANISLNHSNQDISKSRPHSAIVVPNPVSANLLHNFDTISNNAIETTDRWTTVSTEYYTSTNNINLSEKNNLPLSTVSILPTSRLNLVTEDEVASTVGYSKSLSEIMKDSSTVPAKHFIGTIEKPEVTTSKNTNILIDNTTDNTITKYVKQISYKSDNFGVAVGKSVNKSLNIILTTPNSRRRSDATMNMSSIENYYYTTAFNTERKDSSKVTDSVFKIMNDNINKSETNSFSIQQDNEDNENKHNLKIFCIIKINSTSPYNINKNFTSNIQKAIYTNNKFNNTLNNTTSFYSTITEANNTKIKNETNKTTPRETSFEITAIDTMINNKNLQKISPLNPIFAPELKYPIIDTVKKNTYTSTIKKLPVQVNKGFQKNDSLSYNIFDENKDVKFTNMTNDTTVSKIHLIKNNYNITEYELILRSNINTTISDIEKSKSSLHTFDVKVKDVNLIEKVANEGNITESLLENKEDTESSIFNFIVKKDNMLNISESFETSTKQTNDINIHNDVENSQFRATSLHNENITLSKSITARGLKNINTVVINNTKEELVKNIYTKQNLTHQNKIVYNKFLEQQNNVTEKVPEIPYETVTENYHMIKNENSRKNEDNVQYTTKHVALSNLNVSMLKRGGKNENSIGNINFSCLNRQHGKYVDNNECGKFYNCIGSKNPIIGTCPTNTVFSDIKKLCTKDLSHCIRNNTFHCISEGKFIDILKDNYYYICERDAKQQKFLKYTLKCQDHYHLNKTSMKCEKDKENIVKSKCQEKGKFADPNDCRKFYICIGSKNPVIGTCPVDTVFSEIKMQCTKNLSHCIRNNTFHCTSEGRFSDILYDNYYYVCVKDNQHKFLKYKFKCEDNFHLNKTSIMCEKDEEENSQSEDSVSRSSNEDNSSDKKVDDHPIDFKCQEEGKFPDPNDCKNFYVCTKKKSRLRRKLKKCKKHKVFDRDHKRCVDNNSYEC